VSDDRLLAFVLARREGIRPHGAARIETKVYE